MILLMLAAVNLLLFVTFTHSLKTSISSVVFSLLLFFSTVMRVAILVP
jgi:hypothetical protein